ncbi:nitrite/sulfite reductase [Oceanospirillum maris]|uniref:nitrite/sulfite reductase n=1 Tax=Oceanospirillum maris TaxID=64977 RepID=UPI00042A13AA|nr:nitrite/sulfite reductase [Oceanospirillum maris]
MYKYDDYDQKLVDERVIQFRDQTQRYLDGKLEEAEYLPLRLQNGIYIQRLAPMLRVAIPYGMLNAEQLRKLAHVARTYDKGYAHFTTRQNVQFNWPTLESCPDILEELAKVEMHAIQTSGNCIRNTTTDQFAGIALDEISDPRPWCEIVRQWSTFHPEFAFLPRKFKIAISGSEEDRAAIKVHDVGLQLVKTDDGSIAFNVFVGGGLGRTPMIGDLVRENLPAKHLLTYLEAILRVYNQFGRRDNKYKARIKILVKALGVEEFARRVESEWNHVADGPSTINDNVIAKAASFFIDPDYESAPSEGEFERQREQNKAFSRFVTNNTQAHQKEGYIAVTLSLKKTGVAPGDVSDSQMDLIADLADKYSFGELRVSHHQNLILSDVKKSALFELWQILEDNSLATPNVGKLTDMICCPGGDFCALANAKSIPVAEAIQRRFDDLDHLYDLGDIDFNFSGCMNACGHHHIGNIGLLGVDRKGEEFYQISLGGRSGSTAGIGKILGPAVKQDRVPDVIESIMSVYVENRIEGESFVEAYHRLGQATFKERVYA